MLFRTGTNKPTQKEGTTTYAIYECKNVVN